MAALESLTHEVISENHCYRQRQGQDGNESREGGVSVLEGREDISEDATFGQRLRVKPV